MYAGPAAGAGCYGVAMAPGGPAMMPNAGMMPAGYGMPAMYNLQPVRRSQVIYVHNSDKQNYPILATSWLVKYQ